MKDELVLIKPDKKFLADISAYRQEFLDAGDEFHGDCALQHFDNPNEWLKYNRSLENHEMTGSSWIEFDQYLLIRKSDERVVGMINYRSTDNEKLADYAGEIGFSVRTSERNKGYAKEMLRSCIEKCAERGIKNAILTCNKNNHASKRTIIACGGIYERNSVVNPNTERYIIQVNKGEIKEE